MWLSAVYVLVALFPSMLIDAAKEIDLSDGSTWSCADLQVAPARAWLQCDRARPKCVADFAKSDLTAVPDFAKLDCAEDIKVLELEKNEITELSNGVFDALTDLQVLALHDNKISRIAPRVFEPLTKLRSLTLAKNKLTKTPTTEFDSLTDISQMMLGDNPWRTALSATSCSSNTDCRTLIKSFPGSKMRLNNTKAVPCTPADGYKFAAMAGQPAAEQRKLLESLVGGAQGMCGTCILEHLSTIANVMPSCFGAGPDEVEAVMERLEADPQDEL